MSTTYNILSENIISVC